MFTRDRYSQDVYPALTNPSAEVKLSFVCLSCPPPYSAPHLCHDSNHIVQKQPAPSRSLMAKGVVGANNRLRAHGGTLPSASKNKRGDPNPLRAHLNQHTRNMSVFLAQESPLHPLPQQLHIKQHRNLPAMSSIPSSRKHGLQPEHTFDLKVTNIKNHHLFHDCLHTRSNERQDIATTASLHTCGQRASPTGSLNFARRP